MQSTRLELVPLSTDHLPGYFLVRSDWEIEKWNSPKPFTSIQEAEKDLLSRIWSVDPTQDTYAILLRQDLDPKTIDRSQCTEVTDSDSTDSDGVLVPGGFIGYIGVYRLDQVPDVHYTIHRSAWGLGFATEALLAFTELFWKTYPEHYRLIGRCDTENPASGRVMEKVGFEYYDYICADEFQPWMVPSARDSLRFVLVRPGYTFD
ncbi:GNAT family acetyltransferase [Aspergillus nomiae NRRL 13137]|uniref:GNAT family acetyltransferase n=1 Tax=Aspergillus nomiae NRRL (strain ATCC 15546 / NRRL 13137 / CBS 260.88 / M93) TaxID=1509407 RepID=A0A0L1IP16_ASPN3|nr:GNAT family acetyltransferase [Aspergillus nomiae NRRL 13137]KNG81095.1 GNAT family acetyltransferase [Aspergillus nomiae NRRL 13137]